MIDIVPTILEATGIQAPEMVNGIAQKPIEGVSMAYTFDKANADAPSTRTTQYFEMFGNRAHLPRRLDRRDHAAAPPWLMGLTKMPDVVNGYKWELYNIAEDYLAGQRSRRQDARTSCARCRSSSCRGGEVQRLPAGQLDRFARVLTPRPSATAGRDVVHLLGRIVRHAATATRPTFSTRSYTITAEVDVPQGGGEG